MPCVYFYEMATQNALFLVVIDSSGSAIGSFLQQLDAYGSTRLRTSKLLPITTHMVRTVAASGRTCQLHAQLHPRVSFLAIHGPIGTMLLFNSS